MRQTCRDLSYNSLTGTLPAAWGNNNAFYSLEGLFLTGNVLTGTLPIDWMGGWASLQELTMDNNDLTGVHLLMYQCCVQMVLDKHAREPVSEPPCALEEEPTRISLQAPCRWSGGWRIHSRGFISWTWPTMHWRARCPTAGAIAQGGLSCPGWICQVWVFCFFLILVSCLGVRTVSKGLNSLSMLDWAGNQLTGPLPPSWGSAPSMQAMTNLTLAYNSLTGSNFFVAL